jgi:hypothetical protein
MLFVKLAMNVELQSVHQGNQNGIYKYYSLIIDD